LGFRVKANQHGESIDTRKKLKSAPNNAFTRITLMNQDEVALAPIAGWTMVPLSSVGAVMLHVDYVLHPMQSVDDALQTPRLVMTGLQALELSDALRRHAALLESGAPLGFGLTKH